jgi:hypothetical protein
MVQGTGQGVSTDLAAKLSAPLQRWYRAGHAPQPVERLLDAQLSLCIDLMLAFKLGKEIPRRLGGGATPEELARDKKALRKLHHLYELRAYQWADLILGANIDPDATPSAAARKLGAQIQVPEWVFNRKDSIQDWGSELATAAIRTNDSRLANQVVARIEAEQEGLERIQALYA